MMSELERMILREINSNENFPGAIESLPFHVREILRIFQERQQELAEWAPMEMLRYTHIQDAVLWYELFKRLKDMVRGTTLVSFGIDVEKGSCNKFRSAWWDESPKIDEDCV